MKNYVVVQDFNGHLVRTILANTPEEAKEIFMVKTLQEGKALEDSADSAFEWNEIHVEQID